MPTKIQKITVADPDGVLLATKEKYCRCNLQIVPKLLPITVRKNGSYDVPSGYAGYGTLDINVAGKPESELSVSSNGTYHAPEGTVYSSVEVDVPAKTERTLLVSENGEHVAPAGTVYSKVNVAVPGKEEMTLLITKNGTYTAPEGKVYSSIVVNIPQEGQEQIPDGNVITAYRGKEFSIRYAGSSPSIICPDWIKYYIDGGEIVFVGDTIGVGTIILYRDDKLVAQYIIKIIDENHVHTYTTTVVPPDCYNGGYTVNQCSCGDSVISNQTQKLGHLWGNPYYNGKFSTGYGHDCTREGCGYYEDLTTPSCTHQWVFSKNVPATCGAGGYDSYICSLCGAEDRRNEVLATGQHTFQNGKCTVCGAADTTGGCTHPYENVTEEDSKPATCTEAGYVKYWCTKCNHKWTNVIAALGHKYENGVCINCGGSETPTPPPANTITVNVLEAFEIPYTGTVTRVECPAYLYYEDKGGKLECVALADQTFTISLYNGDTVVATYSVTANADKGYYSYSGKKAKGDEWNIIGGNWIESVSFISCSDNLEKFTDDDGNTYLRAIGTGVAKATVYANLEGGGGYTNYTYIIVSEQCALGHTWGTLLPPDSLTTGKYHTCTICDTTEYIIDRTVSVGGELEFPYDDTVNVNVICSNACIECTLIDSGAFYIKGISAGIGTVQVRNNDGNALIDRYNIKVT